MPTRSKSGLLMAAVIGLLWAVLFGCSTARAGQDPEPSPATHDLYLSYLAENQFDAYTAQHGPKAFAVGPGGAFGASTTVATSAEAERMALAICQGQLITISPFRGLFQTCELLARDDTILIPGVRPVETATLPGSPQDHFAGADIYSPYEDDVRGVLLLLLGCDSNAADWAADYFGRYFMSRGIAVVWPGALSKPIGNERCGAKSGVYSVEGTQWAKRRVMLAESLVASIRDQYPGKPVYVWGQGIGGSIATSVRSKTDGVLVAQWPCYFARRTPPGTKTIYLFGDHGFLTSAIKGFSGNADVASDCAGVMGSYDTEFMVVSKASGAIWPWRDDVNLKISQLMGVQHVPVSRPVVRPEAELSAEMTAKFETARRKCAAPIYAAAAADGSYGWSCSPDDELDSMLMALESCESNSDKGSFFGPFGPADELVCSLYRLEKDKPALTQADP